LFDEMKLSRNASLLLSAILAAVGLAYFAWPKRIADNRTASAVVDDHNRPVRVEEDNPAANRYIVEARGELEPVKSMEVVAGISGLVKEVRYKVGDSVQQGAIVAVIEPKEWLKRVTTAEANLTAARSQLAEKERQLADAEKQVERIEALVKQDLIAKQEIDRAQFGAETARAEVELGTAQVAQQEAMLAQSRKVLDLGRLTAPVSGIVTGRSIEPGSEIAEGSAILSIAVVDVLKVAIRVAQRDAENLGEGMAAEVRKVESDGEVFQGKVARLISGQSPGETIAEVQLLNRNQRLKPGMAVTVLIRRHSPTS
jgi:RND family efflux transporter MFP subunit